MTEQQLQEAIEFRQTEIAGYQVNIDNYTYIVSQLPAECDESLRQYMGYDLKELAGTLPFDIIQHLSDVKFRKQLEQAIVIEKLEQRKAMLVLQALQNKNA